MRTGTESWSANSSTSASTAHGKPWSVELARAGRRARSRWLVRGWLLLLAPADTSRRRKPSGCEVTPCDGRRLGSSPAGRFHDRTVTTSLACTRSIDVHAKARLGRHVKATETSEVGPHRAPRVNSPEARWRDPLKRAVRRENGMFLWDASDRGNPHRCGGERVESSFVEARPPRDQSSTGTRESKLVGWQALVERILRVQKAARPEQTLAEGGTRTRSTPPRGIPRRIGATE